MWYLQTTLKTSLKVALYEPKHVARNTNNTSNKLRVVYDYIILHYIYWAGLCIEDVYVFCEAKTNILIIIYMNFTLHTQKKSVHASPSLEQAVKLLFGDCYTSTHWRRNMQLQSSRAERFDPTDTVACRSNGRAFVSLCFKGCYTSPLVVGSNVLKIKQNVVKKR